MIWQHGRMARHHVQVPLRWSDMDAYGHVNNVQFLRLLEEARVAALAAAGGDSGGSLVTTGLIVAHCEIEYLNPLVYRPGPVDIDVWVTRIGAADFDMGYEVLDRGDPDHPRLYARAETMLVVFDLTADRPRRLTPDEQDRLKDWLDGGVQWRRRRSRR